MELVGWGGMNLRATEVTCAAVNVVKARGDRLIIVQTAGIDCAFPAVAAIRFCPRKDPAGIVGPRFLRRA